MKETKNQSTENQIETYQTFNSNVIKFIQIKSD